MQEKVNLLDEYYRYYDIGDFKNSFKVLKKMELSTKDAAWIYAKCAECNYELRKYKNAVEYCKKSLDIQNKYPLALWTLGNSLYYLKKYNESVDFFSEILNMTEFEIGKIETRLGIQWARSLRMDSYLKMADNFYMLCKDEEAKKAVFEFNSIRKKGIKSYLATNYINSLRQKIKGL
jgi:tetratricopeptide (TPR) repeat protein